jgi:hypothetical protein
MLRHFGRSFIKVRSETTILSRLKSVLYVSFSLLSITTCHSARVMFALYKLLHDLRDLLVVIPPHFLNK